MAFRIIGADDEAKSFLRQWESDSPFVDARTSGSTGTPKAVKLPKADMRQSAASTIEYFGLNSGSTLVCPLSASYIAGKMMIVRALEAGCTIVMEKPSNRPLLADYGTIDLMAVVPSQCEALIANEIARTTLRNVIVGGAAIPRDVELKLMNTPWRSLATYGMTETCSHVALRRIGTEFYHAMPGITFATDSRGCLVIEAPAFTFGRMVTNDVAELTDDKCFRWLGRHDNVINSGGVKFHPEQLEATMREFVEQEFYFKGVPHPVWGEAVGMVVEAPGVENRAQFSEEILEMCRLHLPRYAVPSAIEIVERIPRTSNGKVRRL